MHAMNDVPAIFPFLYMKIQMAIMEIHQMTRGYINESRYNDHSKVEPELLSQQFNHERCSVVLK